MTWKNIVNIDCVELEKNSTGEHYHNEWKALSSDVGAKKLGFNISLLKPGEFSCPYHFHHSEEELFLVLEGKAMLRQADRYREVSKGDLIFFETSAEGAHQIYNHTHEPFKYFALSTNDPFEVCEYPDSKKMSVVKLRKTFQLESAVEYLRGEEDPRKCWPKEHLRKN
jgi:uncharacterized cupin superfamily protein